MNLFYEAKKVLDKDGKVNPLGPYGKQKLTGREISAYFRRNPVKDATIRKAVSVALDLEGAMTTAAKEIKKFYGDKVLKSKEVQFALKYANEGVIHEEEPLQEASALNMIDKAFKTKGDKEFQYGIAKLLNMTGIQVAKGMQKQNPKGFELMVKALADNTKVKLQTDKNLVKMMRQAGIKEEIIQEVTQQEVNAVKKLSKDAEKLKKDYFKIAKMGDKELADGKYNSYYESILKMQQKVLSLIGALNNKMRNESTNLMDTYRLIGEQRVEFLEEEKKLKFTNIKDKTLEKHLKAVTKKVGAKLEKISGGFAVSDTDMRGFTAVVDYIFDKSIKKNMLDGGGMSDVTMVNENTVMSAPKQNMSKIKPMLTKLAGKHKKVKVSFGTHSKGKFVDDNNINFNGDKKDIDMLMKDIQKNKSLMKMMESPKLDVMDTFRDMMTEKVSYVEYNFKNKNDAQKAMNMFKSTNLMSFDINDDDISNGNLAVDAGQKDMTKLHRQVLRKFKPQIKMQENYRKLAQKGMGTETKKDARVGLELDYYDSKGNKHMGKIVKKSATGYTVQDDKTRKTHTFKFHDRVHAKKLLAASNEFDKNPLKGFPYNEDAVQKARETERLKAKHAREKESLRKKFERQNRE